MLAALASADAVTWISILVKSLVYTTTLVAAGSVWALVGLRGLTTAGRASLRRLVAVAAVAAAALSILRLPIQASFLMGGSLDGAVDPMMLEMVVQSRLGASVIVRLVGLGLILAILLPLRGARWVAVAGAVLTCASFVLRGHALGDPRLLLSVLVTIHILGLAFWIGALAPLTRAARTERPETAGALAREFGRKALVVIAALVGAGTLTLVLFGAAAPTAIATPYGQAFVVKLALFAGVLSLAAVNRMHLTPALLVAAPGAGDRLRQSIRLEAALVGAILLVTAAATTVSSPPRDTGQARIWGEPPAPLAHPVEEVEAAA